VSTADGWVAGTGSVQSSLEGGPQCILRGCKGKNGEAWDETVSKIKTGKHTGIDGGNEDIIIWRFGV
jgi:hypothetical protein